MQDTGLDRMNKWRLVPPSRDLLSASAGEINAMKHLARGGGMPLNLQAHNLCPMDGMPVVRVNNCCIAVR